MIQRLGVFFLNSHLRNEMSQSALARILNLKDDDLFFSFDADEIPKPEVGNELNILVTEIYLLFLQSGLLIAFPTTANHSF